MVGERLPPAQVGAYFNVLTGKFCCVKCFELLRTEKHKDKLEESMMEVSKKDLGDHTCYVCKSELKLIYEQTRPKHVLLKKEKKDGS